MPDAVTPAPWSCLPLVPVSPSLCGQMPDAVSPCVCQSLPDAVTVTPAWGGVVTQSLRSDARCCDARNTCVSPACLPISPSLCDQMPNTVTPLVSLSSSLSIGCLPVSRGRVSRLSPCISQSLRSDARCRVSRLSPLSPSLCGQMSCLPLVFHLSPVSPSLCGQAPDAVTSCLPVSAVGCLFNAYSPQQGPRQNQLKLLLLCEFWG